MSSKKQSMNKRKSSRRKIEKRRVMRRVHVNKYPKGSTKVRGIKYSKATNAYIIRLREVFKTLTYVEYRPGEEDRRFTLYFKEGYPVCASSPDDPNIPSGQAKSELEKTIEVLKEEGRL